MILAADAPTPFNHKKHAPLKLKCTSCHAGAETGDHAGFPEVARCRTCHVDMAGREIPLLRVYTLPEFTFFAHARHAAAKVECQTCHGNVLSQEQVHLAQPVKMKWCVDCHKQQKAAVTCTVCHELGQ